jgi:hypothetical protein
MSSLYKKRGIFYYQGKDEDGNRIQRSLRTEDRAEAEEMKAKLDERFSTDTPSTLTRSFPMGERFIGKNSSPVS